MRILFLMLYTTFYDLINKEIIFNGRLNCVLKGGWDDKGYDLRVVHESWIPLSRDKQSQTRS